jgi:hypothetical protein
LTESREAAFAPPGPQRSPGRLTRSKTSSSGTPCVKPTNACETHRQSPKVTGCGPAGGGPFPCILNQENGACPAPGDVCCRASSAHDYGGSNRNEIKIMGALLITHHMGFPFCFPSPPPPSPLPSLGGENTLRKHPTNYQPKGLPFLLLGREPPPHWAVRSAGVWVVFGRRSLFLFSGKAALPAAALWHGSWRGCLTSDK